MCCNAGYRAHGRVIMTPVDIAQSPFPSLRRNEKGKKEKGKKEERRKRKKKRNLIKFPHHPKSSTDDTI